MKFDKFQNKSFLFSILSNKDHLPKANGYLLPRMIILAHPLLIDPPIIPTRTFLLFIVRTPFQFLLTFV